MESATPKEELRNVRLTTRVGVSDAEVIAKRAAARGLSVSAYMRRGALDNENGRQDEALMRQIDALIDRMESDLDSAVATLAETLTRLSERDVPRVARQNNSRS